MAAQTSPVIPPPRLQQVRNATPFPHFQFDKMGKGRRFHDVVIVCASFVLVAGRLQPAAVHRGPVYADQAWDPGKPELSSLREATDLLLRKPGADVYVTGAARALDWQPRKDWNAVLHVEREGATLIHKELRLTGPRHWIGEPHERSLSDPEPTFEVPLRYELAYGGWWFDRGDESSASPRVHGLNPSGTGCFGSSQKPEVPRARYGVDETVPAPQLEYAGAPVTAANVKDFAAAGLAPVARHWQPRVGRAGTYDEAWRKQFEHEAFADYASDFDDRFFQYAPDDQVIEDGLRGDEELRMSGFFAAVPVVGMQLPCLRVDAACRLGSGELRSESMKLDTVHIDLDSFLVHLTWRLTLDQTEDVTAIDLFARPLDEDIAHADQAVEGALS